MKCTPEATTPTRAAAAMACRNGQPPIAPIHNHDIVLWYTLGITHNPRPEDWPVMPVHAAGFKLVPWGFFGRNPAMDLPKRSKRTHERSPLMRTFVYARAHKRKEALPLGSASPMFQIYCASLCRANIFGLQALRALLHHEGDACAFIERTIAARRDGGEMNEDILAILTLDKAESLPGVEPLYCTCFSHLSSFFRSLDS